jgi:uncharacterized protein (UPF0332 family)
MSEDTDPVRDQLRQAHRALDDAVGAREADLSDTVVVNRLYYACFHAAQAVLYERDVEPRSHGGVLSQFGSEVVTEGDASRERGRFLNDLSTFERRRTTDTAPSRKTSTISSSGRRRSFGRWNGS